MKRWLLGIVLAGCGGASVHSMQFRGADGATNWWSISCRGDNGLCLRAAGELCPHGYALAGQASHDDTETRSVAFANGSATGNTVGRTTYVNGQATSYGVSNTRTITNGELTIKCTGATIARLAPGDDPECAKPVNQRLGGAGVQCSAEVSGRQFLSDDPRERERESIEKTPRDQDEAAKTK